MRTHPLLRLLPALLLLAACSPPDVVIYCSLDQPHSEPILAAFEKETGLDLEVHYDQEANKTVGQISRIVAERDNPNCDVFWNNELVHTVRLKRAGLLQPYRSPQAAGIPPAFKDPEGYWTGFAARVRVFIVNEKVARKIEPDESKWPKRTEDLLDPRWRDTAAIAKPLLGTTLTHMAVLWSALGPDWVKSYWRGLADNDIHVASGNASVMESVSGGSFAVGFTDTDDFQKAANRGDPVRRVFPDQDPEGRIRGALLIPNTVCLIRGARHPEAAKRLIDWILRPETEEILARGSSAQIPLHPGVPHPSHVKTPEEILTMKVDWEKAAEAVKPASDWLRGFLR